MMYGEHMGAGGWVLSVFVTLLVVTLIVLAIVWLVRADSTGAPRLDDGGREPARELLDRRLASSEIDEDEYRRLRAALSEAPTPAEPGRRAPA